jgi:hypothetical protein
VDADVGGRFGMELTDVNACLRDWDDLLAEYKNLEVTPVMHERPLLEL